VPAHSNGAASLPQPSIRPRSLEYARDLSPSARAIYAAATRIAKHRTRGVRISNAQLAREAGVSAATLTRQLPNLHATGLMVRTYTPGPSERYSHRVSEYVIPWHPLADREAEAARRAAERKAAAERERRARKATLEAERRRRLREVDAARQLELGAARGALEAARAALADGDQGKAERLYAQAARSVSRGGVNRDQGSSCDPSPVPSPPFGGSGNPEPYPMPRPTGPKANTGPADANTHCDAGPPPGPSPEKPKPPGAPPPPLRPPTPEPFASLTPGGKDDRPSAEGLPGAGTGKDDRPSAEGLQVPYPSPGRATAHGAPPPAPPGPSGTNPPEPLLGGEPEDAERNALAEQARQARAWREAAVRRAKARPERAERKPYGPRPPEPTLRPFEEIARAARAAWEFRHGEATTQTERIRIAHEICRPVFASDTTGPEVEQCPAKISE